MRIQGLKQTTVSAGERCPLQGKGGQCSHSLPADAFGGGSVGVQAVLSQRPVLAAVVLRTQHKVDGSLLHGLRSEMEGYNHLTGALVVGEGEGVVVSLC